MELSGWLLSIFPAPPDIFENAAMASLTLAVTDRRASSPEPLITVRTLAGTTGSSCLERIPTLRPDCKKREHYASRNVRDFR